jgi:biopolymer transport protein ExbD
MARSAVAIRQFAPPFSEMNTTPLIDVMLVLLVMFILAVPAAVNEVPIDLPATTTDPVQLKVQPDKNTVAIGANSAITWNDTAVSQSELAALLSRTRRMVPEPELRFQPDPQAPYDSAARVLNQIKASGVSAFGFVGNDTYAAFGKAASAH